MDPSYQSPVLGKECRLSCLNLWNALSLPGCRFKSIYKTLFSLVHRIILKMIINFITAYIFMKIKWIFFSASLNCPMILEKGEIHLPYDTWKRRNTQKLPIYLREVQKTQNWMDGLSHKAKCQRPFTHKLGGHVHVVATSYGLCCRVTSFDHT